MFVEQICIYYYPFPVSHWYSGMSRNRESLPRCFSIPNNLDCYHSAGKATTTRRQWYKKQENRGNPVDAFKGAFLSLRMFFLPLNQLHCWRHMSKIDSWLPQQAGHPVSPRSMNMQISSSYLCHSFDNERRASIWTVHWLSIVPQWRHLRIRITSINT